MLIPIVTVLSILTVVYPKVVLTVVFILTLVYILTAVSSLSDYSPQHSPHSYFHVIIICSYPAVRVKFYAYVNMILTYYLLEKDSCRCKPATTRRKEQEQRNDSFGKGFLVLKDHVLNRLMTGRCPSKYCSYGRSSTRFFSKIASIEHGTSALTALG